MRQVQQRCVICGTREDCIWLQVVAGAAALAGRMRKSAAEQLSDALAAGDSGGLGLRDIDRLLQVRIVVASAPVQRGACFPILGHTGARSLHACLPGA